MCTKPKEETLDKRYPNGGTSSLVGGMRLKNDILMEAPSLNLDANPGTRSGTDVIFSKKHI